MTSFLVSEAIIAALTKSNFKEKKKPSEQKTQRVKGKNALTERAHGAKKYDAGIFKMKKMCYTL